MGGHPHFCTYVVYGIKNSVHRIAIGMAIPIDKSNVLASSKTKICMGTTAAGVAFNSAGMCLQASVGVVQG